AKMPSHYPKDILPEIVICGRSNVGKSSLINALTGIRGLARVSSTPGATRAVNFFRINKAFYLVDLPGYGYAKTGAHKRGEWAEMVERYIGGRPCLVGAIVLIDARRGMEEEEEALFEWLNNLGLNIAVVFTKADKLKRHELSICLKEIKTQVHCSAAVAVSSKTGLGVDALIKEIRQALLKPAAHPS
ncbi:MAG: ribosome biogenesis GTP-binding protein YihA/YsxC, partial [Deltaproteobacteria bacterium]